MYRTNSDLIFNQLNYLKSQKLEHWYLFKTVQGCQVYR